jgi:hypothetical protein
LKTLTERAGEKIKVNENNTKSLSLQLSLINENPDIWPNKQ